MARDYIPNNVRHLAIALSVLLLARVAPAAEEKESFHLVQLSYVGNKTEMRVLSAKEYDKLKTKMGTTEQGGKGAAGKSLPKWIVIRGTYPTRAAAEAKLGKGAAAKAENDLVRDAILSSRKSGTAHRPVTHDPGQAQRARAEFQRKKSEVEPNPKIKKVKPIYNFPDKLVDTKPIYNFPDKLVDTSRLMDVPGSVVVVDEKREAERRKKAELERQAQQPLDPKALEEQRHADDLAAAAAVARKLRTDDEKRAFAAKLRAGAYPALTKEEREALLNSLRVPETAKGL